MVPPNIYLSNRGRYEVRSDGSSGRDGSGGSCQGTVATGIDASAGGTSPPILRYRTNSRFLALRSRPGLDGAVCDLGRVILALAGLDGVSGRFTELGRPSQQNSKEAAESTAVVAILNLRWQIVVEPVFPGFSTRPAFHPA